MVTSFITDNDKSVSMTDQETGQDISIPRYAYWTDMGRGKPEVKEVSDDVGFLKNKYNVSDDHIINMKKFKPMKRMSLDRISQSKPIAYGMGKNNVLGIFHPECWQDRASEMGMKPDFGTLFYDSKDLVGKTCPKCNKPFGNTKMNELNKFRSMVKECISEIRVENDPRTRLKESLRSVVKRVLNEMSNSTEPELDEDEKETISKGYNKKGNERLDKSNEKQLAELETIVHGIDAKWEVYWDDHNQLIVRAQNLLYVRIVPKFENNFDVDAMVKLVDRVRAIGLDWDQVKSFIKANFGALKNTTNADNLKQKALDQTKDNEVIKKSAGPENSLVKNRFPDAAGAKIKSTKRDDMDYNEPQTKKDEDMPDQPMKKVTEPGKDPESKNKNIKTTDKVKPPKHKNDKKLRVSDKKTTKFKR